MIDWSKAPEWANYAAMDKDGDWFYYENLPIVSGETWIAAGKNDHMVHLAFEYSLMERPK